MCGAGLADVPIIRSLVVLRSQNQTVVTNGKHHHTLMLFLKRNGYWIAWVPMETYCPDIGYYSLHISDIKAWSMHYGRSTCIQIIRSRLQSTLLKTLIHKIFWLLYPCISVSSTVNSTADQQILSITAFATGLLRPSPPASARLSAVTLPRNAPSISFVDRALFSWFSAASPQRPTKQKHLRLLGSMRPNRHCYGGLFVAKNGVVLQG